MTSAYVNTGLDAARYATVSQLPTSAPNGALAVTLDTGYVYEFNANTPGWQQIGGSLSDVTSLNGLTGALTIVAGSNITVTPSGHNITIAAAGSAPGGSHYDVQTNNGSGGLYGDNNFQYTGSAVSIGVVTNIGSSAIYANGAVQFADGNFYSDSTGDVTVGTLAVTNLGIDNAGNITGLSSLTANSWSVDVDGNADFLTLSVGFGAFAFTSSSLGNVVIPGTLNTAGVANFTDSVYAETLNIGTPSSYTLSVDASGNIVTPGNAFVTGLVKVSSVTASSAVATNSSKELVASATTATQLGYLSTATSDVQVQLNSKLAVTASASFTGQTTPINVAATTPGSLGTYRINAYVTITAISVDVMVLNVTYTDETNTFVTVSMHPQSTSTYSMIATGVYTFPSISIRANTTSAITVVTSLTTSSGSITYDAGAAIERLF